MDKRRRKLILVGVALLSLGIIGYIDWHSRLLLSVSESSGSLDSLFGSSGSLDSVFGSSQSIDTVKHATSVKAFRLRSPNRHHQLLSDYQTTAGPIGVSAAVASDLRGALLDTSSYLWNIGKLCEPDYGVRIQFQHNTDKVDVLLCFQCDVLGVYHNGKAVARKDFDPARPQLVLIVKELFPDDEAIQSLVSRRATQT